MRLLSSIRILRVGLALAVALWMAGAGCMLGCENMVSAFAASDLQPATKSSELVVSGDACASMHGHDCCAKRSKSVAQSAKKSAQSSARVENAPADGLTTSQFEATSSGMFDCPLAINANAALTKSRPDQSNVATLSQGLTPAVPNAGEQTIVLGRPLRLPNRGHTYLRCCAFLI